MARWTWGVGVTAGPFWLGLVRGGNRSASWRRTTTYGSWSIKLVTMACLSVYMLPSWLAGLLFVVCTIAAVAWWVAVRPLRKAANWLKK